jgi:metal-responsive CopG/Arc/MetJ family transcriptional regulator
VAKQIRITVLVDQKLYSDLDEFCKERAQKKSTLVASLIKEYLRKEGYPAQPRLL